MPGTVAGLSLAELEARKAQLQAILYQGAGEVRVHGVVTVYRSVEEIQTALADLEDAITEASGLLPARSVRLSMRSGYCG